MTLVGAVPDPLAEVSPSLKTASILSPMRCLSVVFDCPYLMTINIFFLRPGLRRFVLSLAFSSISVVSLPIFCGDPSVPWALSRKVLFFPEDGSAPSSDVSCQAFCPARLMCAGCVKSFSESSEAETQCGNGLHLIVSWLSSERGWPVPLSSCLTSTLRLFARRGLVSAAKGDMHSLGPSTCGINACLRVFACEASSPWVLGLASLFLGRPRGLPILS